MAVQDKDKLVSLEDLKTAYDDLGGDISDVKNTLTRDPNSGNNMYCRLFFKQGGKYSYIDNSFVQDSGWGYTDLIPCSAGKTYFINTPTAQNICFYDSNGDFIEGAASTRATAPTGSAYIRLSVSKSKQEYTVLTEGSEFVYFDKITNGELVSISEWTSSKIINKSGEMVDSTASFKASDYADVHNYKRLKFTAMQRKATTTTVSVAFYDSSKVYLPDSGKIYYGYGSDTAIIADVEVPEGAAFARFSYYASSEYSEFVCVGNIGKETNISDNTSVVPVDDWTSNYIINKYGTAVSTYLNFKISEYVDIHEYNTIEFSAMGRASKTTTLSAAFYDSSKNFISGIQYDGYASDTTVNAIVEVPTDTYYVRFTYYLTNEYGPFIVKGSNRAIDNKSKFTTYETIEEPTWENSYVINSQGNKAWTSGNYKASGFVDVHDYSFLYFTAMARSVINTTLSIAFYDSTQEFIAGQKYTGYLADSSILAGINVPAGAYYARFTYYTDNTYPQFNCYGNRTVISQVEEEEEEINHIRFMVFGNSYGCDSVAYVPFILKNLGITSEIYLYVRDACSLRDIYNRWESSAAQDVETDGVHAGTYQRFIVKIDTRVNNSWQGVTRASMKDIVSLGNWDFVTLQQYSQYTVDPETYRPWLPLDIELIDNQLTKGTPIAYTHVWTRKICDYPVQSIETFEDYVYNKYPFEFYIPCGTAIFSARSNPTIKQIGAAGDLWCDDQIHLQEGLPRYIGALTIVEAICRKFFPKKSVLFDKTEITDAIVTSWNVPEPHLPVVGMTDENRLFAQKTVIAACDEMFTIQDVGFTPFEEYASLSAFPASGKEGVLYKATDTGYTYTWDGTNYVLNEVVT